MIEKIKHWFKNYWYYYKWIVIVVAAFAAIFIFCTVQSVDSNDYDIQILYTGPYLESNGAQAAFEADFNQILKEDFNGDGKKISDIVLISAFTDEQIEEALDDENNVNDKLTYAMYTVDNVEGAFSQQAFAGDCIICLLDDFWYQRLLDGGGLVKIEEVLGYKPDNLADDYSAYISSLKFFNFFEEFKDLPEGTRICFRTLPTASAFTGKKQSQKNYENSKKYFKDLFEF